MLTPLEVLVVDDALDALLLGSFFFGLAFVVISFVLGFADAELGHDHGGIDGHGSGAGHLDWLVHINVGSILAFLTWFGGIAYLLRNAVGAHVAISLAAGALIGFGCAAMVARLVRALRSHEVVLDERQERLSGALARVSSSIREDGTGEVTYVLNGVRQVTAARSASGLPLPRGAEVVILRRERGIAFVEPWADESPADAWERRFAAGAGDIAAPVPLPDRQNS